MKILQVIKNFVKHFMVVPFVVGTIFYLMYRKFGGCSYALDLFMAFVWWMSINYISWSNKK